MQTEIVIAGFGGQGVLFAGQLIAYAAMECGLETTWYPSYGPEMRGGTANCTVIVADEEIGAPVVRHPMGVIAMNRPSLDKYEPLIKPGGVLVINSSIVDRAAVRTDIEVISLAGNDIAETIGDRRMTNMVLLGALLGSLKVIPLNAVEKVLGEHLPERHKKLLPLNINALHEGAAYSQQAWV